MVDRPKPSDNKPSNTTKNPQTLSPQGVYKKPSGICLFFSSRIKPICLHFNINYTNR